MATFHGFWPLNLSVGSLILREMVPTGGAPNPNPAHSLSILDFVAAPKEIANVK
jgi:hypothetical protein